MYWLIRKILKRDSDKEGFLQKMMLTMVFAKAYQINPRLDL